MTRPLTVLKSVGPKLVPFFKTLAIYFVLFGDEASYGSIFYAIIKCLPVISLIVFVLLHGMNLSEYYAYSRRILAGLIFSCLGDIFLVWKHYCFEHGLAMFAVAQLLYASAFGMRPLNPWAGLVISFLGSIVYTILSPGLTGIMNILVPMYLILILFMAWRAVARVQLFDDLWTWTKLCGCAGSIAFLISDLTIALDKFVMPIPFGHTIIMTTYYAAQFGIALSVVDSPIDVLLKKTSEENGLANGQHSQLKTD
ncbi:lysoplasmalogenase-like protein TMEM86A [Lingula anatina]|uniref:lysoplasmalogenase n=1 Tax=Lingula anatina TaxID=7574 RepID=A0A1S3JIA1_LINAN|nr:lysoplasmalogenase-like protein TMEM86A [Lingula anatina]|eukprot:XP_013409629.1 lysoplasmalogenase-like protein TMEM86A [Lingula anatina]